VTFIKVAAIRVIMRDAAGFDNLLRRCRWDRVMPDGFRFFLKGNVALPGGIAIILRSVPLCFRWSERNHDGLAGGCR
jgi:hypothetical protein